MAHGKNAAEGRSAFLDLPAELRLKIYDYLLPPRRFYISLRPLQYATERKAFKSLTETCRKVYDEVSYEYYERGQFNMIVRQQKGDDDAQVEFLTQCIPMDEFVVHNNFLPLQRIKRLRLQIKVPPNDAPAVCTAQDALMALVRRLKQAHNLISLEVVADLTLGPGCDIFAMLRDGQFILPYLTAPLHLIRRVGTAAQPAIFTLAIGSDTHIHPARKQIAELEQTIRDAICSNAPLPEFVPFFSYFGILKRLKDPFESRYMHASRLSKILHSLCKARIDRDDGLFKDYHTLLVVKLRHAASVWERRGRTSRVVQAYRTRVLNIVQELEEALVEIMKAFKAEKRTADQGDESKENGDGEEPPRKRMRGVWSWSGRS